MNVGDLTSAHIGKRVRLSVGRGEATSRLLKVEHGGNVFDIMTPHSTIPCALYVERETTVTLQTFGQHVLPSDTEIELQEEA